MRGRVSENAAFALTVLLSAVAPGYAQVPPPPTSLQTAAAPPPIPGFVPPYEIMRTVRSAGFDPLAPPLREGTAYVLRANDFRGILMRVVVDARTGAIRDVNRIVPGPGSYGQASAVPSAYGYMTPPYGTPPDFDAPDTPDETGALPPPSARPPAVHPVTRATVTILPPLPRPRPAELTSRKVADEAKPEVTPGVDAKPEIKSDVTAAVPAAVSTSSAAPAKPSKTSSFPPIND